MRTFKSEVAYHAEMLSMQAQNSVMTAYEKGLEEATKSERKRIIKLLDEYVSWVPETKKHFIALIKAEDNE